MSVPHVRGYCGLVRPKEPIPLFSSIRQTRRGILKPNESDGFQTDMVECLRALTLRAWPCALRTRFDALCALYEYLFSDQKILRDVFDVIRVFTLWDDNINYVSHFFAKKTLAKRRSVGNSAISGICFAGPDNGVCFFVAVGRHRHG